MTDDNTKGRVSGGPSSALFAASTTVGYTTAPAGNFDAIDGAPVDLLFVLLVRPQGLFGEKIIDRV